MKEQSFATLFRQSSFAKWHMSQPIQAGKRRQYIKPVDASNVDDERRPRHFGLKRDLPERLWGTVPEIVQIKGIDAEYEQTDFKHCRLAPIRAEFLTELQRVQSEAQAEESAEDVINAILGFPSGNQLSEGTSGKSYSASRYWMGERVKLTRRVPVVGRLVHRTESGYQVAVVGVLCTLPLFEIPKWGGFSMDDVVHKRAFRFYVKSAEFPEHGQPQVVLSLKEL